MKIKEMLYDFIEKNHSDLNKLEELAQFVNDYFTDAKEDNSEFYHDLKKRL